MIAKFPFIAGLILLIAIMSLSAWLVGSKPDHDDINVDKPITPRDMNGVDTIRANDSLYVITFKIEKVLPDTISNESQDKYEYDPNDHHE